MCIMSIHCHHYYLPSHWLWPNKLTARTEEKTVSCPYRIDWRKKRQAVNSWRCNLPYCAPRTSSSGVNCFVLRAQWCEHVETFIVRLLSWFVGPWLDQVGSPTTNQTARLPAPETLRVTISVHVWKLQGFHFFLLSPWIVVVFGLWDFALVSSYPAKLWSCTWATAISWEWRRDWIDKKGWAASQISNRWKIKCEKLDIPL